MDPDEVLGVQDAVLVLGGKSVLLYLRGNTPYLSSGVDDLGRIVLATMLDNPAECVLNGRVVALDEVMFDELNGQRRFT